MMLRKLLMSSIIAATAVTASSAIAAGSQGQGSGTVKFHGYIIDAPCSLVSPDPIQVESGQISRKTLQANNNTGESSIQPFYIELADCSFDDNGSGQSVNDKVSVTFTYGAALGVDDQGNPVSSDLVGFDGTNNMGAGIAIVSNNTLVKNGQALPSQQLQTGPNTIGFTSYVKGLGIADVPANDTNNTPAVPSIKTGEFYATANFTLSYE